MLAGNQNEPKIALFCISPDTGVVKEGPRAEALNFSITKFSVLVFFFSDNSILILHI